MRRSTIAALLLGMGVAVGLAAAVALALGLEPPHLSPFLYRVVVYKLAFIAALGLIAAGAALRRWARRAPADRAGHGTGAG